MRNKGRARGPAFDVTSLPHTGSRHLPVTQPSPSRHCRPLPDRKNHGFGGL